MNDKKNVLSTDDLAPRPRAVNEAAASQITGGLGGPAPPVLPPSMAAMEARTKLDAVTNPVKPPPAATPAKGKS